MAVAVKFCYRRHSADSRVGRHHISYGTQRAARHEQEQQQQQQHRSTPPPHHTMASAESEDSEQEITSLAIPSLRCVVGDAAAHASRANLCECFDARLVFLSAPRDAPPAPPAPPLPSPPAPPLPSPPPVRAAPFDRAGARLLGRGAAAPRRAAPRDLGELNMS
ncbi:Protein of unknown function [Gryllus bimaculatus]|nr:Protein of unknown function [Gryllus bimaculatus]